MTRPVRRRIRLVHWNAAERKSRAAQLRAAGFTVAAPAWSPAVMKALRRRPPDAVVIDLSRSPSQGRDVGMWLRTTKATRHVPIVFVNGAGAQIRNVKRHLADAAFCSWSAIAAALRRAIAQPLEVPAVPPSVLAGYSGTPLPKKLGIKPGATVVLVDAPRDFTRTLGSLPAGVVLRHRDAGARDLTIWFTKRHRELERRIARLSRRIGHGGLWICWPKQSSGVGTDVTQHDVRRVGLAAGLVDYKICAVDETWSGLKFARRR